MRDIGKKGRMIIWLLLFLMVAAFCAVHFLVFLKVPMGVNWQEKEQEIYGGGICRLEGKVFSLKGADGSLKWNTGKKLLVQDFLVTDLDGDEDLELILLVWKRGRYGSARPFWVKADEKSYSQHIFIYDVSKDLRVKEKWLASDIGPEVTRFKLMEKNPAVLLTEEKSGRCSLWMWESWGLKSMDNTVNMVAFGDNIIHDSILDYGLKHEGGDFSFLYEPFRKEIQEADIAAFNSETPLVDKASAYGGYPSFGAPVQVGEALVEAGFDVAACANNHCMDRGIYGIDVTSSFYRKKNVACLGIHSPFDSVIRESESISRNGMTFELFNYTYGVNEGNEDGTDGSGTDAGADELIVGMVDLLPKDEAGEAEIVAALQEARESADAVIVFVHWGEEYSSEVSEEQRHFAQIFAEGGADVVIGSHPHVLQPVEELERPDGGKTIIYYSLGNFRADQGKSDDTKTGGQARIKFEHGYDGVRVAAYDLKEIEAWWK